MITTRALLFSLIVSGMFTSWNTMAGNVPAEGSKETAPGLILAPSAAHPQTMVALTQAYRYSFLAPRFWSVSHNEESKVVRITSPDQKCLIQIHFADDSSEKIQSAEKWHAGLLLEHTGATLDGTFTFESLSATAAVADLSWIHADLLRLEGRFTRIPVGDGCLELSLVTSPEHFEDFLPPFMQLVGSLRSAGVRDALEVRAMGQE